MVTIDLQKDAESVQKMLAKAVKQYIAKYKASATAKKHPPVTRIDLVFSLGDGESTPWVHLHFDTKPGSEPDGDPTHPDFAKLTREGWRGALLAVYGEKVNVVRHDGSTLCEMIGNFLVAMLLEGRSNGVFADLPKTDRCELGVEDPTTGAFGWPIYEERGKKNLVT
jgi:hypothetical protein